MFCRLKKAQLSLALCGRLMIAVFALAVLTGQSAPGFAQGAQYPSKPIRIIVAVAAGGPTDLLARLVGQKFTEKWGQQVIIDNRPGAGQLIGTAAAAKADPDGYTLLMTTNVYGVNPWLFKELNYDYKRDFVPITEVAKSSLTLVVHPSVPASSLKELIAYAKANPGKLKYASSGPSSSLRLAAELLKSMAGIDMVHVPYNGAGPMVLSLVRGETQVAIVDSAASKGQITEGLLRPLAVTSDKRSPNLPDIPTMIEAGLPGYSAGSWFGLMAPRGTPEPIIQKLQDEVASILRMPDVVENLKAHDEIGIGSTPAQFAAFVEAELVKWKKVVEDNNITAE